MEKSVVANEAYKAKSLASTIIAQLDSVVSTLSYENNVELADNGFRYGSAAEYKDYHNTLTSKASAIKRNLATWICCREAYIVQMDSQTAGELNVNTNIMLRTLLRDIELEE